MADTGKRGKRLAEVLTQVEDQAPADLDAAAQAETPPPERQALSTLTMYVTPEDHERIRGLSFHSKQSIQKLGIRAWSLLMEDLGHAPLKDVSNNKPSGRRRA